MSFHEQNMYFEILPKYESKFTAEEKKDYTMLRKRHRDEEDLDRLSMERLKNMYVKYHVNRPKKNYDHLFKKPETNEGNE